jgi:hypothetical protein
VNLEDPLHKTEPYILIEGPRWGDAEFYGKWLLAAAKAEALWKEAISDPSFEKQIELVTMFVIPDFSIGATVLLSKFEKNPFSISVGLTSEDVDLFNEIVMMVEMGFFVLTGERYQMVIPTKLKIGKVKRAALKFAQTQDVDGILRPEHLVATMPCARAKEWQTRLRRMDEYHRCADRLLLLGASPQLRLAKTSAQCGNGLWSFDQQ